MSKVRAITSKSKWMEMQSKPVFLNFRSGTRRLYHYKSVGSDTEVLKSIFVPWLYHYLFKEINLSFLSLKIMCIKHKLNIN